jgi:hypothetical protein
MTRKERKLPMAANYTTLRFLVLHRRLEKKIILLLQKHGNTGRQALRLWLDGIEQLHLVELTHIPNDGVHILLRGDHAHARREQIVPNS